jgi:hypothetical protein
VSVVSAEAMCTKIVFLPLGRSMQVNFGISCGFLVSGVGPRSSSLYSAVLLEIPMTISITGMFQPSSKYEGVRPIHIYLLRLLYILMFFVLGRETWTQILTHQGPWDPFKAVAWCVWTAFATLAGLGIFRPLKMLPIVLLEIFYKVLWLTIVAYPLWAKGALWGSPAESIASPFLWVILPIVVVPWGYVFVDYIYKPRGGNDVAIPASSSSSPI